MRDHVFRVKCGGTPAGPLGTAGGIGRTGIEPTGRAGVTGRAARAEAPDSGVGSPKGRTEGSDGKLLVLNNGARGDVGGAWRYVWALVGRASAETSTPTEILDAVLSDIARIPWRRDAPSRDGKNERAVAYEPARESGLFDRGRDGEEPGRVIGTNRREKIGTRGGI